MCLTPCTSMYMGFCYYKHLCMNELKRLYLLCRQCDNLPAYKAIKQVRIWIAEIAITSIIKEVNDLPPIVV